MLTNESVKYNSHEVIQIEENEKLLMTESIKYKAFTELERGVRAALETYSNVHRGSGHFSLVSTHLFEQAREIVLNYIGLDSRKYVVIFCTPRRTAILAKKLEPNSFQLISSKDIGISLGVTAVAVKKHALPKGIPFQTGGGTTKLISKTWIVWASKPDKFEAGTPAIINIIAFAKALLLLKQYGKDIFINPIPNNYTAAEILYHDELEMYTGLELLKKLRLTLIGSGFQVPTMEGIKPFINLDNSASTPAFAPVWNSFSRTLLSSSMVKQEIVQEVKSLCAKMMNAPLSRYDVIFTSNTTEAINLAAESLMLGNDTGAEPVIVNSILEHSSNDLPWRMVPGASLIRLSVNSEGFIDLNELENLLIKYNQKLEFGKKRISLVTISSASNVLGVCNNIAAISRIVHQYGAKLMVDAAQLAAHRKIDMDGCGIDYLVFSAHKVYAPFGCGVLISRKGLLNFNSSDFETIQSSGEENVAGIAALGKALVLLQRIGMDIIQQEEQILTAQILKGLTQINGLKVYGIKDTESFHITNKLGVIVFGFKGMMANKVANELALQSGIGVRYGCHCAHIIIKHLLHVPPFLEQFQRLLVNIFSNLRLPGLVRISLGIENTAEDVERLIQILQILAKQHVSIERKGYNSANKAVLSRKEVENQIKDFAKAASLRVYNQAR